MLTLVWFAVGVLVGAGVVSLVANARAQGMQAMAEERVREFDSLRTELADRGQRILEMAKELEGAHLEQAKLGERLGASETAAAEKVEALLNVEKTLKESFAALAANALDANSRGLLQIAQKELEKQQGEAKQDLAAKEIAIKNMLKPVQDSLAKLEAQSVEMEKSRAGAYEGVLAEIRNIQSSHVDLRRETTQLVQALRAPKVRGNWGEMQLRRCVEFAGMVEHASFEVEQFVRGEETSIRPDMVVKLPNGRTIIVDAKAVWSAFLDATNCEDEVQRKAFMMAHARQVKTQLDSLSGKNYSKQFVESPDFIVCFLPSEVLFSAALENDPSLLEYSASSNVLLATPTTLIALLKAVAFGWQQSRIARDAEKIREAAIKVHEKLAGMHGAILTLGDRLRKAGDAYDDMLVKAEGRGGLFSVSRKLRELRIGEKDLADGTPAAMRLKPLEDEDWQPSISLAAEAEDATQ